MLNGTEIGAIPPKILKILFDTIALPLMIAIKIVLT